jgi:Glutaredoxin
MSVIKNNYSELFWIRYRDNCLMTCFVAEQVRARLDGLIKDSPVLFLNFETCPYCVKAKAILDEKNCRYVRLSPSPTSDFVDGDNSCYRWIP